MKNSCLAICDVETTGLSPRRNALIEVHILRTNGTKVEEFSSLINPGIKIPSGITRLTGITNEMVANAPRIEEVITNAGAFIKEDDVFVGHNVRFDYAFMNHNFHEVLGRGLTNQSLCTLRLARRVFPGLFSYKLSNLCNELEIQSNEWHRAKADVHATKKLFDQMYSIMHDANIQVMQDVLNFQKMPIRKATQLLERE